MLSRVCFSITNVTVDTSFYMHVENIEENAEPRLLLVSHRHRRHISDLAITGRNHCACILGDNALGITKEPQKESRQQAGYDCPCGMGQPAEQNGGGKKGYRIEVAITNHGRRLNYSREEDANAAPRAIAL